MMEMPKENEKKYDVVYIYRYSNEDRELKLSLRSLRFLKENIRQVWIIGDVPSWVRNIKYVYCPDRMAGKQQNAMFKLMKICSTPDVSEDFILMNDDFIFLKDQKIRSFTRGVLNGFEREKRGNYKESIINSLKVLGGGVWNNFEVHYPMIINKRKFLSVLELLRWSSQTYVYRSVYGNLHIAEYEDVEEDFKAFTIPQFFKKTELGFVSLDDRVAKTQEVIQWLNQKFPKKSKYEVE